jgi:hypothetical protein
MWLLLQYTLKLQFIFGQLRKVEIAETKSNLEQIICFDKTVEMVISVLEVAEIYSPLNWLNWI